MRRSVMVLWLAILGIGSSACGNGDAPEDPAMSSQPPPAQAGSNEVPDLDPCGLVSRAEIEAVVGIPVAEMTQETPVTADGVKFYGCRSNDVHIGIEAWSNEEGARDSFRLGGDYPAIEDFGLPARTTQPLGEIDVLAGHFVVTVDMFTNQDQATQLEAAKQLARLVIERLP